MAKRLSSIHPGEILSEEFLAPLGISQYRLAQDVHVPPRRINEIVKGLRAISADTALRLGPILRHVGTILAESSKPIRPGSGQGATRQTAGAGGPCAGAIGIRQAAGPLRPGRAIEVESVADAASVGHLSLRVTAFMGARCNNPVQLRIKE